MRKKKPATAACPNQTAELAAAFDHLAAVPIKIAGHSSAGDVATEETIDALDEAARPVARLIRGRELCALVPDDEIGFEPIPMDGSQPKPRRVPCRFCDPFWTLVAAGRDALAPLAKAALESAEWGGSWAAEQRWSLAHLEAGQ
jgi:hypothetical protein